VSPTPAAPNLRPLIGSAMAAMAVLMVAQIASRAVRDSFFLSRFPATALPPMIAAAALVSIAVALLATRALAVQGPRRFGQRALLASAVLHVVEWAIARPLPQAGAVLVYLHVAALAPVLLSAFWSQLNETFDPRAAKGALGRIGAVGTLGGLLGGLVADQVTLRLRWPATNR
jgi:hypothetical protein